MERIIYSGIAILVGIVFAVIVTACTTTQPTAVEHCDAYLERVVTARIKSGGMLTNAGADVTADGIVLFVQVTDPKTGQIHVEAVVDTAPMVAQAAQIGLKTVGQCERGGKAWQTLSGSVALPRT